MGPIDSMQFNCMVRPLILTSSWVHKRFDHNKSSSYVKDGNPFAIQYGTGSLEGVFAQDTLTIAGLSIPNQSFAESTHEDGMTFTMGIMLV